MRELLYDAARHYKRGKALAERGDLRGAMAAFEDALRELHAVKPQRMRDVLLAQVYLSRYQVGRGSNARRADSISYRTQPKEKMSERSSARSPRACSGDM